MDWIEKEAPSVPEAVFAAARALGIEEKDAQVQVLSAPGARRAKVRVGRPGVAMPEPGSAPTAAEEAPERAPRAERQEHRSSRPAEESRPATVRNRPTPEQAEAVRAQLAEMLNLMGTPGEVEVKERAGNVVLNVAGSEHESLLIGRRGQTVEALQHLLLEMCQRREKDASLYFVVDVADYFGRQEQRLVEKARGLAEQVLREGGEMSLGPLSPAERRVVHVELKPMEGIETFSVGSGSTKKLVIRKKD